jgi:formiminotetrahydrofolate cyclodeaminase
MGNRKGVVKMTFMDMTLSEFQSVLASENPTPGGGTASAVALGQAGALACMVAKLTLGSNKWETGWPIANETLTIANPMLERAGQLAKEDSEAFDAVMEAYRMPKSTDDEKDVRRQGILNSTLQATLVPLETAEHAVQLLSILPKLAEDGNSNAVTDVGVAGLLASAAAKGALFNVKINLSGLNENQREQIEPKVEYLTEQARTLSRKIMDVVKSKLD